MAVINIEVNLGDVLQVQDITTQVEELKELVKDKYSPVYNGCANIAIFTADEMKELYDIVTRLKSDIDSKI